VEIFYVSVLVAAGLLVTVLAAYALVKLVRAPS
jgi:hypothetical protein